jgi:hypothetical protein
MQKRKLSKKVKKIPFKIVNAKKVDILKELAKQEPGSVLYSYEAGKAFIKKANGGVVARDIIKTGTKKIKEIAQEEYRKSRL